MNVLNLGYAALVALLVPLIPAKDAQGQWFVGGNASTAVATAPITENIAKPQLAVRAGDATTIDKSIVANCERPEAGTRDDEFWSNAVYGSNKELLKIAHGDVALAQTLGSFRGFQNAKNMNDSGAFGRPFAQTGSQVKYWTSCEACHLPASNEAGAIGLYTEYLVQTVGQEKRIRIHLWKVVGATEQPIEGSTTIVRFERRGSRWEIKNLERDFSMPKRGWGTWEQIQAAVRDSK